MGIDDQRVDEYYSSLYSPSNNSDDSEHPYRPLVSKPASKGIEKKFAITDEICDSDNFEEDDHMALNIACMAAVICSM